MSKKSEVLKLVAMLSALPFRVPNSQAKLGQEMSLLTSWANWKHLPAQYIMKKKKNIMTQKQLLMEETQQWGNKP